MNAVVAERVLGIDCRLVGAHHSHDGTWRGGGARASAANEPTFGSITVVGSRRRQRRLQRRFRHDVDELDQETITKITSPNDVKGKSKRHYRAAGVHCLVTTHLEFVEDLFLLDFHKCKCFKIQSRSSSILCL